VLVEPGVVDQRCDQLLEVETFDELVERAEPRLREALTATLGNEAGREATADAIACGWEHWARVGWPNPAGLSVCGEPEQSAAS
jgi:hypothetical protein